MDELTDSAGVLFLILLGYSIAGVVARIAERHERAQVRSSRFFEIRTPRLRKHLADALRAYRRRRREESAAHIGRIGPPPADHVPPYLLPRGPLLPDATAHGALATRQAE